MGYITDLPSKFLIFFADLFISNNQYYLPDSRSRDGDHVVDNDDQPKKPHCTSLIFSDGTPLRGDWH